MKIEIPDEAVDKIIVQELTESLEYVRAEIKEREEGGTLCYYHRDPVEDIKRLKKQEKALRMVLDAYVIGGEV